KPTHTRGPPDPPRGSGQPPRSLAATHSEHRHWGVSVIGSKSSVEAPKLSVVWNRPSAWETSWATVSPTTSGPHAMLKAPPHPVGPARSALETIAPPAVVPPKVETPGIAPSYPTVRFPAAASRSVICGTKK